jgi:hypothetical protein
MVAAPERLFHRRVASRPGEKVLCQATWLAVSQRFGRINK